MNSRLLLGALVGISAVAALPSAANASSSCVYSPSARTMTIQFGASDSALTVRNGGTLEYRDAAGTFRSCFGGGVFATGANTDRVSIKASANPKGFQSVTIDETNGDFSDTNPRLHFSVLTGTGFDRLTVKENAGASNVRLRQQTGLGIGPAVDLDFDGDDDINMTTTEAVVQIDGGNGNDFLDASNVSGYQVVLQGENGNDTLIGGKRGDTLDGGQNDDRLFGIDSVRDNLFGGLGFDRAQSDFNVDNLSSVESNQL
jgi:Ca2+-binding RTX toxin-like protein